MQLDDVLGDREADAEAAVPSRRARLPLAKAVEDMREELGADAGAGIMNDEFEILIDLPDEDLDMPAS